MTQPDERRLSVSRTVDLPASVLFDLMARPANHVRFDTSGMIAGATSDDPIEGVGSVFVMDMSEGDQVVNTVVVFEPGRAVGWAPAAPGEEPAGHTWVWRFEPLGKNRCKVSLTYDWTRFSDLEALPYLPVVDEDGLRRSLDLVAEVAEGRTPSLEDLWPVFGLSLACGDLDLRPVTDDDLPSLAAIAVDGLHDDDMRPFPTAWASGSADKVGRELASRIWRARAEFSPEVWSLPLAVRWQGRLVGLQGAEAEHYPALRRPDTYSWLGRDAHGHGIGTLMRQTICAFLFDELDAAQITSGAYLDNPVSAAVSRKVGYRPNGGMRELRDGIAADHQRFLLRPDDLVRPADPLVVMGAAPVRRLIGVGRPSDG